MLKLFFDGGCRPNPGPMETAVVARGIVHHATGIGIGSNDQAEWRAARHALRVARDLGATDIVLVGDSARVVAQANGAPCRSAALAAERDAFRAEAAGFARVRIRHIGRAQNLAGTALEKRHGRR
ncbi:MULTISPECIES: reverse transcriptase-like protein [unclassified Sphingomonas]|uniref:reverse transcriptase-like protein n=1 Tax=unclassified Sphingomonas TaxID=196159 RepID=UPI0022699CEF|nr:MULTISPECIES: reverse transcriptase-like protein [unclassified Sphingomonas]